MTEQTSRLAIVIDSTGAERQADNLATALNRMTQSGNNAADSGKKVTKATEEEKEALSQLLDRIDPVNAALNKLDKQQQELARFKAKGFIDTETFDLYSKKIEDAHKNLTGFNDGMKNGTITAGQYKQAMRQLPAQFTDIFTSIAGGMPLWLIFTQQGGQIADSFGGWSSLLDVIKREVLGFSDATEESSDSLSDNANGLAENADHLKQFSGLLTPTGLAVAALAATVGLLTYSYYKGSQEQEAFNESLILTGNIVGKTSGQLADMSRAVASSAGSTVSMSSDVLNQLVASGKVAEGVLTSASEAIIKLNDATGIATSKLVSDFEAIGNNPVEAIKKLTDQYHFLDLATYNQIRALQEQGNQQEAARIASDAYSAAIGQKADEIKSRLGPLRTAWNDLGDAAKGAWDKMWDFGRETSIEEKIAQKQGQMGVLLKRMPNEKKIIGILQGEIDALMMQKDMQDEKTGARAGAIKADEKAIKAQEYINTLTQQTLTNEQKRTKEQEKLTKAIKDGAQISKAEEEKLRKNINDKYKDPKDPKTPKGKAYTEDAATRLLDQLNQQNIAMQYQLGISDKMSSATQQRVKFEQQIADLKGKSQLTADQKSLLSRSEEILQAYKAQEAISDQVKTLDDYRKMQEAILPKELKQNETLKERLDILQKMVALKKLTPEAAGQQASNLIGKTVLPDSVISGVNRAGGTLTSGATNSDLSGQGLNMIGLKVDPQLETLSKLKQAQTEYAEWLNQQQQAITQSTLLNEQQKQDQLLSLYQTGAQNQQAISTAVSVAEMQVAQNAFSSITDSMGTMFGEQSSMYKAAFATQKAFAIAQAALQLPMAMGQALAGLPFPANLAAIAQVVGLMSTITSSISSVAANGFMSGGYTGNMATNAVAGVVHGKEFVFDAAATKKIGVSNLEALRNGKPLDATLGKSGFGTGAQNVSNNSQKTVNNFNPNVTVSNSFTGKPDDATLMAINQSNQQLAKQIKAELASEIVTPQGRFGNALKNRYGRRGPG
ncbi:TPA: phage tail length tape measure family protein [Serratia fonticola]